MQKKKIAVGILGATGSVGQKFIELLNGHPWFEITELGASHRSAGKTYKEAANWFQASQLPENIAGMVVKECKPPLNCRIVFSGLDASVAGEIEQEFADAGYIVVSNSKNHRMRDDVPLLIPDVNPSHLELLALQPSEGKIITNPNCSTIGLVSALKPLDDAFGIEKVHAVTLQALSGAGYPGISSLDIIDNVIPHIGGEEAKMEEEALKIMGKMNDGKVELSQMLVSAQCNRVAVVDGHTESVSVSLKKPATEAEIIQVWKNYESEPQKLDLPFAPKPMLRYFDEAAYPQPKLHRNLGKGMAVSIGGLRPGRIFDYKFTVLSHNTIRGAAGCAILNAELMVKKGYVK